MNSQLPYALRHGRVRARPGIERLDEDGVVFADGSRERFDTIVWATGYHLHFLFLDPALLQWRDGAPVRTAAGTVAPGLANLYFTGLTLHRGGGPPAYSACGQVVADLVGLQRLTRRPVADIFGRLHAPSPRLRYGLGELMGLYRRTRAEIAVLRLAHRAFAAAGPAGDSGEPTALAGVRALRDPGTPA